MIDMFASLTHFADHLAPVWDALPGELRGRFMVEHSILATVRQRVPEAAAMNSRALHDRTPILVAASGDMAKVGRRPLALMEHGIGQTYLGRHPSYAGGLGREKVKLFLTPNERAAELNRRAYPLARHEVIGVPRLDAWMGRYPRSKPPVVALAWHWNCQVAPEAKGAWPHYRAGLGPLMNQGWRVIGHGHPRLFRDSSARLAQTYRDYGIEVTQSFDDVLAQADVLVADNTSVMYEFAATGRPVVVANAPWYRRDVNHGGRFWEWADVGPQIEGPEGLVDGVRLALGSSAAVRLRRASVVRQVFGQLDGQASVRAADAIGAWLAERERRAAA